MARVIAYLLTGQFRLLWYRVWIRLAHVDLSAVSVQELGLLPELSFEYSNSGGPNLEAVLKRISIPTESRIIDFGCGKGGAAFTMARFPFSEIVGIDVCPSMISIAQQNAHRLGYSFIQFVCADATEVTDLDCFTHVYLFNPFPPVITQRIYTNLLNSLQRKPRNLILICKYPEGSIDNHFPESVQLRMLAKMEFKFSHPFYVFRLTTDSHHKNNQLLSKLHTIKSLA